MIIFYPQTDYNITTPVVVLDVLDSSDRYSVTEILAAVYKNAPTAYAVANYSVYSCQYSFEYIHKGIPLGESMKTRFMTVISTPPSELISQMSPNYFVSAQSTAVMADALATIANPQTTVVNSVLIVKDNSGNQISRKFIAYSAQVSPDPFGSTISLVINGAALDDLIIKSEAAYIIDRKTPLKAQLTALLSKAGYVAIFDTSVPSDMPITEKMFPPLQLNQLLDEICLQNKLVHSLNGKIVTFYSQTKMPSMISKKTEFSFLGYKGALAWSLGVENYANIIFKTLYFDAKLYQPMTIYNDIKNEMFYGMVKNGISLRYDAYDTYLIRYIMRRTKDEVSMEIASTNNWLLAQTRVDGLLEASVYGASL